MGHYDEALGEQSDGLSEEKLSNKASQREASFWGNIEQASREVQNWPHWKKEPYEANLPQKK